MNSNLLEYSKTIVSKLYVPHQTSRIAAFVAAVRATIDEAGRDEIRVVFEGAVANPETLLEIVSGLSDFQFIYFNPANLEVYADHLISRFMRSGRDSSAGLPEAFWKLINSEEFEDFCSSRSLTPGLVASIHAFAEQSLGESEAHLAAFREIFPEIIVVV